MSFLGSALKELADPPAPVSLDTFQRSLEPRWIEEALQATGTATLREAPAASRASPLARAAT